MLQTRFNVIQFNSVTEALFPDAVAATPADVALAREWVAGLRANGGTEMLDALRTALRGTPPLSKTCIRMIGEAPSAGVSMLALLRTV